MKRYRDASGRLTMTIDQIAAATLDEAREYYQDGGRYIYEGKSLHPAPLHRQRRPRERRGGCSVCGH